MRARRAKAPDWTDANESDPGIAILELFAFLGEALTYSGRRRAARRRKLAVATLVLLALWKVRSNRSE